MTEHYSNYDGLTQLVQVAVHEGVLEDHPSSSESPAGKEGAPQPLREPKDEFYVDMHAYPSSSSRRNQSVGASSFSSSTAQREKKGEKQNEKRTRKKERKKRENLAENNGGRLYDVSDRMDYDPVPSSPQPSMAHDNFRPVQDMRLMPQHHYHPPPHEHHGYYPPQHYPSSPHPDYYAQQRGPPPSAHPAYGRVSPPGFGGYPPAHPSIPFSVLPPSPAQEHQVVTSMVPNNGGISGVVLASGVVNGGGRGPLGNSGGSIRVKQEQHSPAPQQPPQPLPHYSQQQQSSRELKSSRESRGESASVGVGQQPPQHPDGDSELVLLAQPLYMERHPFILVGPKSVTFTLQLPLTLTHKHVSLEVTTFTLRSHAEEKER